MSMIAEIVWMFMTAGLAWVWRIDRRRQSRPTWRLYPYLQPAWFLYAVVTRRPTLALVSIAVMCVGRARLAFARWQSARRCEGEHDSRDHCPSQRWVEDAASWAARFVGRL